MSVTYSHAAARSTIAVIMGGGRGTRLWPMTKYRAKPAVPLAGKYRLIDIPISNCLNSGMDRIYILTQFMSSSLNRHITATYHLDPFSRGFVALEAASQSNESSEWYQGTADAVRRNLKTLAQWQTENVVILPGDTIFRMDLSQMVEFHMEKKSDITIALHATPPDNVSSFGIMAMDDNSRITDFREKVPLEQAMPLAVSEKQRAQWNMDPNRPFLASMGMYVFKTSVLVELMQNTDYTDFGHHLLPEAVNQRPVHGYVFNDFWEDVGTIGALYDVNINLARQNPPFRFYYQDAPIYTRMRFLPSTQLNRSTVNETRIAEGCLIDEATLESCMIGLRSRIGRNVKLTRTVVMGADYYEDGRIRGGFEPVPENAPMMGIGDDCVIEHAMIDKNARVGEGCRILNQQGLVEYDDPQERYYIRDGIVIVPKHGILEPGTVI